MLFLFFVFILLYFINYYGSEENMKRGIEIDTYLVPRQFALAR